MTQFSAPAAEKDQMQLAPGKVVDGRFVVERQLGKGGQGVVFKVKHLEWNRDFALKLPIPGAISSNVARERYLKEAQTWIRMGVHPNIVRCWFVRPIAGLPGLFLDLVTGGTLEHKMKAGEIAPGRWEAIVVVLLEIMEGLVHSHGMGVVHRDLKPENLMVTEDGRLCITDFGLVKTLKEQETDEEQSIDSVVTEGAMGTPRYGAPEQWLDPDSVSTATDIYSFGVIFFELLCGRRPFDPPGVKIDPISLINKHITEPPPDPRSIRPDVPAPLAELCLNCLEKDPASRPPSAQALLDSLVEILRTTCDRSYLRPSPIPAGERPNLLNNAAASLFSLGKSKQARELLLKGLMLEAGHPECLYNLVQLDRKEAKIDGPESFRRLKRVRANFELALLYLEESQGKQALQVLKRLPRDEKRGFVYRIQGDACMYAGEFVGAERSYEMAHRLMPNDLPSAFRREMAAAKVLHKDGRIYFPSVTSSYGSRTPNARVEVVLSPDSECIVGVNETEVVTLSIETNSVLNKASRPDGARAVTRLWTAQNLLLAQDSHSVEMWSLEPLRMLRWARGRVLAADGSLSKLTLLTENGVVLVNGEQTRTLVFPPEIPPSSRVLVSFGHEETGFCLMTPDGRLAVIDGDYRVAPLPWPPPFPNPSEICGLQLGLNAVFVVTSSGKVYGLDPAKKRYLFDVEVGFVPSKFTVDEEGRLLVLSSDSAFAVINRRGRVLLRGQGPCGVDSRRRHALVWESGVLNLYQLSPFHRLRTWEEKIPVPRALRFAADGRKALSLDAQGEYKVWEVDEDSRVYERNLLLTPGETYEELIRSYEEYQDSFRDALGSYEAKDYHAAYRALLKARSVAGFQQAEEALRLQWRLCGQLQREGMEAIWERLYIPDVVSGYLAPDSGHLLIATSRQADLFSLSGPKIDLKVNLKSEQDLVGAAYLPTYSDGPAVVTLTRQGALRYHDDAGGALLLEKELEVGRIRSLRFGSGLCLLHTRENEIVTLALDKAKILSRIPLPKTRLEAAFPLEEEAAMLVTSRRNLLADLGKGTVKPGLPLVMERFPGLITFVRDLPRARLRMTGFSDGTLILSYLKTGQPLFAINQENGPVSGAALNLETALGVSVSSEGGITFFDLSTGRVLDRFVAHAEGVDEVAMTEDGRYLTTRSSTGQFRLWEISWKLSDRPGVRPIDWFPASSSLGGKLGQLFGRK